MLMYLYISRVTMQHNYLAGACSSFQAIICHLKSDLNFHNSRETTEYTWKKIDGRL